MKTAAAMDDHEDTDKQIKIVGQILCLSMSSSKKESWDWNKHYIPLDIDSQDKRMMHHQYVGFFTGILWVGISHTIPVMGIGTYHTVIHTPLLSAFVHPPSCWPWFV